MMPTKTSVGPKEVVRLEVLRLAPPLPQGNETSMAVVHQRESSLANDTAAWHENLQQHIQQHATNACDQV
jgi:hypothetical protein